jgi:hypothetical protein
MLGHQRLDARPAQRACRQTRFEDNCGLPASLLLDVKIAAAAREQ